MGLGPMHLFVLAAIALIFFGPSKLPGLGKSLGEAIRGFKSAMDDVNGEADRIAKDVHSKPAVPSPQPSIESVVDVTDSTTEKSTDARDSVARTDSKTKPPVS